MASYSIDIPGTQGVVMQKGDTLTINYKTPAKFCISSGNASDFTPDLPVNVAGTSTNPWTGTANVTNATISYSSVGHDKSCGSGNPRGVGGGTIQIGTGTK
jgi:hypothetical protein